MLSRVSTVVVQRFCKPKVGGSNPSPGTTFLRYLRLNHWFQTIYCHVNRGRPLYQTPKCTLPARLFVSPRGARRQTNESPKSSTSTSMNARCECTAPRQSSTQQVSMLSRSFPPMPRTILRPF